MSRGRVVALLAAATAGGGLAGAAVAPGAAAAGTPVPTAGLEGTFAMSGTVTAAKNVLGEHVGDKVQRTWTFTPLCSTGPCATAHLVRSRANGADALTLQFKGAGLYVGSGRFYAPLRCAGRLYRLGQRVSFQIRLRVAAVTQTPSGKIVTAITATYVNSSRRNLTPCIGVLGHDSARYTGQLVPAG